MKIRIVVTQDMNLNPKNRERLKSMGDVTYYLDLAKTTDEWLKRCLGNEVVLSGKFGLKEKIYDLAKGTFVSLPFVGAGWIDKDKIENKGIIVSRSPGCNKSAVSEWIIVMIINLLRDFPNLINLRKPPANQLPEYKKGLVGREVVILGAGNIGSRVGKICKDFDMKVKYFEKGDILKDIVKSADVVVDTLSLNVTTIGILDKEFFQSLKKGSYFITVTSPKIYDVDAMIEALDSGILAGAANDSGSIQVGDTKDPFYQKMLKHPKILATPHIAYNTDCARDKCNEIMIDNVEAWLKGKPVNLI